MKDKGIESFWEKYSSKNIFTKHYGDLNPTLKSLVNIIKEYNYTESNHYTLLKADAYANKTLVDDGENIFKTIFNFKIDSEVMYKLFIPYLVEKMIVYSNQKGKQNLIEESLPKLHNIFNSLSNIDFKDGEDLIKKIGFLYSYEQMKVQENTRLGEYIARIIELYKPYPKVNTFLEKRIGLKLEKLVILHWLVFAFITRSNKTTGYFSITQLKEALNKSEDFKSISSEDIDNFLSYYLISLKGFREYYFFIRTDIKTGKLFKYDRMTKVDRFMPKVSQWFPLIKYEDNKDIMCLTSYTSLVESLKFERLYSFIIEKNDDKDFKSKIHGPAVNNYIKNYVRRYLKDNAKIYGDESYFIKREQFEAPDIIIEFESFVIIVEAKSSPFNMIAAITSLDTYDFNEIKRDIKKSERNINRYLQNKNAFDAKKVFRMICYFFEHPDMLASLDERSDLNRIIITDIKSIEHLVRIKNESLDVVLENFLNAKAGLLISSLKQYCTYNYGTQMLNLEEHFSINKYFKKVL